MDQKRNSLDATAKARRQSFHDMKPATGFVGNMWNRYVARVFDLSVYSNDLTAL